MNKYQLKERSLLLVSYAMIREGFRILNIDPLKVNVADFEDKYDLKMINLYKKMYILNKSFISKKIQNFLNKRLSKTEDSLQQECQPLYIGLLLLYFYKQIDVKKDFNINELSSNEIKEILYDHNNEFGISKCTIDKSIKIFTAIYPDKESYVNYLQITNKFPFDIISK